MMDKELRDRIFMAQDAFQKKIDDSMDKTNMLIRAYGKIPWETLDEQQLALILCFLEIGEPS